MWNIPVGSGSESLICSNEFQGWLGFLNETRSKDSVSFIFNAEQNMFHHVSPLIIRFHSRTTQKKDLGEPLHKVLNLHSCRPEKNLFAVSRAQNTPKKLWGLKASEPKPNTPIDLATICKISAFWQVLTIRRTCCIVGRSRLYLLPTMWWAGPVTVTRPGLASGCCLLGSP